MSEVLESKVFVNGEWVTITVFPFVNPDGTPNPFMVALPVEENKTPLDQDGEGNG